VLRRQVALLFTSALPLALVACSSESNTDPRTEAPLVRTAIAEGAGGTTRSFSGVVAARTQSDLGFRVSGKILERLVDAGQAVKRGQPLMRLDPIDLGLQAQAQKESVAAARARAKQAIDDEERYRGLVAEGAISASTYDQIKAAADTARAQLAAAEAQAGVAQNAASYSLLVADADGVVVDTLAEPGQVVSAGQTVVRLARAGQREALVQLPETLRPNLGTSAKVELFGHTEKPSLAKLRLLSNAADKLTRTYEARYVLDGDLANAPLGATVTVALPDGAVVDQSVRIPLSAMLDQGKGAGVWVVEGKPAVVKWHPVQVVSLTEEEAHVKGAVKNGDQVVSLGAYLLHEGETVRLAEANVTKTGDSHE